MVVQAWSRVAGSDASSQPARAMDGRAGV